MENTTPPPDQPISQETVSQLSPAEALKIFSQDPVGFIHEVMATAADFHLGSLREQVDLQSALLIARKTLPNFNQFEPYILQELGELIASDKDGILEPWPVLIEQAMERFRQRFSQLAKEDPAAAKTLAQSTEIPATTGAVRMEGPALRQPQRVTPQFSRQEIGKMSLEQFMANEGAINQALKERRIK